MTKETNKPNPSRRHLLAGSIALAPAALVPAVAAAAGVGDDAPLRALFAEWEPLNAAYVAANDAVAEAETAYHENCRKVSKRADIAQRAAAITEAFNKEGDARAELFKGEMLHGLGIPSDYYGEETGVLAASLRDYFKPHIRPDETIADFLHEANAEILAVEQFNDALDASLKTADLDNAACAAQDREWAVVEQIIDTPAQGVAGLTIKAVVWEKCATDRMALRIINDILRLGGASEISEDRLRELFA